MVKRIGFTGSMATLIYEMYYELKDLVLAMKKAYEMPKQKDRKMDQKVEWMLVRK